MISYFDAITASLSIVLMTLTLAVSLAVCGILYRIYYLIDSHLWQAQPPKIASATALVNARKAEYAEKSEKSKKPHKACGHCGVQINSDPVKGIAIDEKSYLVYSCASCKKETVLAQ